MINWEKLERDLDNVAFTDYKKQYIIDRLIIIENVIDFEEDEQVLELLKTEIYQILNDISNNQLNRITHSVAYNKTDIIKHLKEWKQ